MTNAPPEPARTLRQRAEEKSRASDADSGPDGQASTPEMRHLLHELRVHQIELEMQNEELRREQEELDAARARYFDLYDLAPVGYLTFGANGLILEANLAAAIMFGVARNALLGKPVSPFIFHEDQDIYYLHRKRVVEAGELQVWEMRMMRADGSMFWAHLQAVPAQSGECWMTLTDITDRKQAETILKSTYELLDKANRAKADFLAHMSHELRTPLNAIIGFAEIIADEIFGTQSPKYPEYAKDIRGSGEHLLSLINDILDLSKIEAGKLVLSRKREDVTRIIGECVNIVGITASAKKVDVVLEMPPDLPQVDVDIRALRQVMFNLLSNAIKFTPEGGKIEIVVRATESPGTVDIDVRDTGVGIPPDMIDKVFEPFCQGDITVTHVFGGTGLGLSISRRLVEMQGGSLTLESEPGRGTTIHVTLPV